MFFEFSTTLLLQVIMVVSTIIGSMLSWKYLIAIVLFFEKHHCKAIIWCTQARNKVGITSNVVVGHMIIETTDFWRVLGWLILSIFTATDISLLPIDYGSIPRPQKKTSNFHFHHTFDPKRFHKVIDFSGRFEIRHLGRFNSINKQLHMSHCIPRWFSINRRS